MEKIIFTQLRLVAKWKWDPGLDHHGKPNHKDFLIKGYAPIPWDGTPISEEAHRRRVCETVSVVKR